MKYASKAATGREPLILDIDKWVHSPASSGVLLIVGPELSGKTTLIAQWLRYHRAACQSHSDTLIFHAVRPDAWESNYTTLIYRVCCELRRRLNIPRRPHLSEAGLRLYFSRWLEMTDQRLVERGNGRCVILLDDVDKLRTVSDTEEIADWLPLTLPERVKIIVTLSEESRCYRYLKTSKSHRVFLPPSNFLPADIPPGPSLPDRLKAYITSQDVNYPPRVLRSLLSALVTTHRGLRKSELFTLAPSLTDDQWDSFLETFSEFVLEGRDLYMSNHAVFARVVREVYSLGKEAHTEVVAAIGAISRPRESVEKAYHWNLTGNLTKLKDLMSDVHSLVPLLLPEHKLELSVYWQRLEHACIDPVIELTTSLEYYFSHFRPSSEVFFPLLMQLLVFFLEYSQLESVGTPEFRHPHLKGANELKELHLLEELQNMDMFAQGVTMSIYPEENFSPDSEVGRQQAKATMQPPHSGPLYYHYKRWLWISFPWLYLNTSEDFSKKMQEVRDLDAEMDYWQERAPVLRLLHHFQPNKDTFKVGLSRVTHKALYIRSLAASPCKKKNTKSASVSSLSSPVCSPKSLYDTVKTKQLERDFAFHELATTSSPMNILSKLDAKIKMYTNRELSLIQRKNGELVRRLNRPVSVM